MIEHFAEAEIRDHCRARIESVELWLRRLIDQALSRVHGAAYFDFEDDSGNRLIKRSIVDALDRRIAVEPERYPRRVDAILLDDAVSIICNPAKYKSYFEQALSGAFPGTVETLRGMLGRLLDTRNRLSHANPISLHEAYRMIAYSEDIVSSVRQYYAMQGMSNDYNVPTILRVHDSFGNSLHRDQMMVVHDGGCGKNFTADQQFWLRPGDTLTVEVEIDSTFDPSTYTIRWSSVPGLSVPTVNAAKVVIPITNGLVAQSWMIQCRVTTDRDWHRMSLGADDFLGLWYKVLPPL